MERSQDCWACSSIVLLENRKKHRHIHDHLLRITKFCRDSCGPWYVTAWMSMLFASFATSLSPAKKKVSECCRDPFLGAGKLLLGNSHISIGCRTKFEVVAAQGNPVADFSLCMHAIKLSLSAVRKTELKIKAFPGGSSVLQSLTCQPGCAGE